MQDIKLHIGITGAHGFIGERFMLRQQTGFTLSAVSLRGIVDEIDLSGIDVLVHLAGRAHATNELKNNQEHFLINTALTKRLANHAKKMGVSQFIFMSTVKVYGDVVESVLDEASPCYPTDAYGKSKLAAEQYLQSIASDVFKVAIVRSPLVYGPGVKGNLLKLLTVANSAYPIPLGGADNLRSMVYVDNLIDMFYAIIKNQATGVFVAGDAHPISTQKIVSLMRQYMGRGTRIIAAPTILLWCLKKIKPGLYERLFGSFVIDPKNSFQRLGFVPSISAKEGVAEMVRWFLSKVD